jgi:hypothetical protein
MSEVSNTSSNADLYGVQPIESQAFQKEEGQMQEIAQKVSNTLNAIFNNITYGFQKILADITYDSTKRKSVLFNRLIPPAQKDASHHPLKLDPFLQKEMVRFNRK